VKVRGWLFFDAEHWSNPRTPSRATRALRATAWEIHRFRAWRLYRARARHTDVARASACASPGRVPCHLFIWGVAPPQRVRPIAALRTVSPCRAEASPPRHSRRHSLGTQRSRVGTPTSSRRCARLPPPIGGPGHLRALAPVELVSQRHRGAQARGAVRHIPHRLAARGSCPDGQLCLVRYDMQFGGIGCSRGPHRDFKVGYMSPPPGDWPLALGVAASPAFRRCSIRCG